MSACPFGDSGGVCWKRRRGARDSGVRLFERRNCEHMTDWISVAGLINCSGEEISSSTKRFSVSRGPRLAFATDAPKTFAFFRFSTALFHASLLADGFVSGVGLLRVLDRKPPFQMATNERATCSARPPD